MDAVNRLLGIMRALRDPEAGCPWDLRQTYTSLAPYTLEEAYEVVDAIERDDTGDLREELGDLLFHIVFYAQIAQESGHFTFFDVAETIAEKMERRHPHVFSNKRSRVDEASIAQSWEKIKAEERRGKSDGQKSSQLDGITEALPSLISAEKIQKRVARVGFDWGSAEPVFDKVQEELEEVRAAVSKEGGAPDRVAEEVGDLLFAVVNLARHLKVNPEVALRAGNKKFVKRFQAMEILIDQQGEVLEELSLDAMNDYWKEVKKALDKGL